MTTDYGKYLVAVSAAGAYYYLEQASADGDTQEMARSTEMEKQAELFWESSELDPPGGDKRHPPPWTPPNPPPPFST